MIICAICGKPATLEGKSKFGFVSFFCNDCAKKFVKNSKPINRFYTTKMSEKQINLNMPKNGEGEKKLWKK